MFTSQITHTYDHILLANLEEFIHQNITIIENKDKTAMSIAFERSMGALMLAKQIGFITQQSYNSFIKKLKEVQWKGKRNRRKECKTKK
jgi:hypothetical protein